MRKPIANGVAAALLLLSVSGGVLHAAELDPEVEKLVQHSIELRRNGQDRKALEELDKAAAIAPGSLRIVVHLANTHQALGNWLEAADYLERALQNDQDDYVRRHQKTLRKAQEVVAKRIGQVEIAGGPSGAEVRLSGRKIGTLPMEAPARATVGEYTLEVSHPGYYSASRPISVRAQALVRESIELRLMPEQPTATASAGDSALTPSPLPAANAVGVEPSREGSWLPWGLGIASGVAAATAATAWGIRERHAARYNDDSRCWNVMGQTRDQLCGGERDAASTAQAVAVVGGLSAVLLAAGAVIVGLGDEPAEPPDSADGDALSIGGIRCNVLSEGVQCHGTF